MTFTGQLRVETQAALMQLLGKYQVTQQTAVVLPRVLHLLVVLASCFLQRPASPLSAV